MEESSMKEHLCVEAESFLLLRRHDSSRRQTRETKPKKGLLEKRRIF